MPRIFVVLIVTCGIVTAPMPMKKATVLNDVNFEARSSLCDASNCNWFILFYVPWCQYCKEILPVWDRLAEEVKGELMIGKIDMEANLKLKHRFRHTVKGFPTMLYIDGDGGMYAYSGSRDIIQLKDFARREWATVQEGARSALPPEPESLPVWERYLTEPGNDLILAIVARFQGIWSQYRQELLCAISVSLSLGCYIGFLLRGFIDSSLPLPNSKRSAAAAASSKSKAA